MVKSTDRNQLQKLFQEYNSTESETIKAHKIHKIKKETISFKKKNEIIIKERFKLNKSSAINDYHIITQRLENFPEWAIPFVNLKFYVYSNSGVNYDVLTFSTYNTINWKYIAENTYEIQMPRYVLLRDATNQYYDVYCDISLIVLNERVFNELSNTKI